MKKAILCGFVLVACWSLGYSGTIQIVSPTANSQWAFRTSSRITWNYSGISSSAKVDLALYENTKYLGVIRGDIPIANRSVPWMVGLYNGRYVDPLHLSGCYRIVAKVRGGSGETAQSDCFRITRVRLLTPMPVSNLPQILSFTVSTDCGNYGVLNMTNKLQVPIRFTYRNATHFRTDESTDFTGDFGYWRIISNPNMFTKITNRVGPHTVYLQLKDSRGRLSALASDDIYVGPVRYNVNGEEAYDYAINHGFQFGSTSGSCKCAPTRTCRVEGTGGAAQCSVHGSLLFGCKGDFYMFAHRLLNPEWKIISYETDSNMNLETRGGGVNKKPQSGGRDMEFRVHLWCGGGGRNCYFRVTRIVLEGPPGGQWRQAFE